LSRLEGRSITVPSPLKSAQIVRAETTSPASPAPSQAPQTSVLWVMRTTSIFSGELVASALYPGVISFTVPPLKSRPMLEFTASGPAFVARVFNSEQYSRYYYSTDARDATWTSPLVTSISNVLSLQYHGNWYLQFRLDP